VIRVPLPSSQAPLSDVMQIPLAVSCAAEWEIVAQNGIEVLQKHARAVNVVDVASEGRASKDALG